MKNALVYKLVFCVLFYSHYAKSQQINLDFLKNKEGIVVFKFSICDKGNDEYCLYDQDFYINNKRHTIVEFNLLKELDSFLQRKDIQWKPFHDHIVNNSGYHEITGTSLFSQKILASASNWIRGTGGNLFVLKEKNKFYTKDFYIVYKIKGDFALVNESLDEYVSHFFSHRLKTKKLNNISYPLVEALKIHSFSSISKRDMKKLGLKHFSLPYYRINTAYEPELFEHAGENNDY